MHDIDLILTFAGGLGFALLFGYITQRVGLSPIVGYLLAGVAVGPHTPGFVADKHLADQIAELGVILLMFGVGLHFHLKDLLAVRKVAIPGAIAQIAVATVLGLGVALVMGWGTGAGLVFGMAISVASTVVLLRVLADYNELHTRTGHIAIGWLIVEDLFTVLILVLLPILAIQNEGGGALWGSIGALLFALVKIALLMVFVVVAGGRFIPWLLNRVARTRSRELFTLTVLVVALGIAVGSAKVFGVSMALGAFLAGMVVGRSEFSARAASEALPMRDAFAVIFFVSVGMLFNFAAVVEHPGLILLTLGIVLVGKPLAAVALVILLRLPLRVGLGVGVALGQIGEFSFILAVRGRELGMLPDTAMDAIVVASIVSISLNPLLYRLLKRLDQKARGSARLWSALNKPLLRRSPVAGVVEPEEDESDAEGRKVIVVGYGPVGKTLMSLLSDNGFRCAVIELNIKTVRELQEKGVEAYYGDAVHRETLEQCGVSGATALIFSSANMEGAPESIRIAKDLNPSLRVFARVTYLQDVPALASAGADEVFSSEGEVAVSMTSFLMEHLGATPEQIDRHRDQIRNELFGA